jgi:hypothetical protein
MKTNKFTIDGLEFEGNLSKEQAEALAKTIDADAMFEANASTPCSRCGTPIVVRCTRHTFDVLIQKVCGAVWLDGAWVCKACQ